MSTDGTNNFNSGNNQETPPPVGSPIYQQQAQQQAAQTQRQAAQQAYPGRQQSTFQPVAQPIVAAMPPVRQRGLGTGAVIGLAIIAAICIVMCVSVISCSATFNGIVGSMGMSSTDSDARDASPKVGVISMDGTIAYDGSACSPGGLRVLLDMAAEDDSVKAVVLRINSGGGAATAGEEMAKYVADFPKPIVVSSAATNASAAYEISSQADYIFTAKTTSIGSIGVAMQVTDLSGLYEKLGINIDAITSADAKDSTYGNRPLTDEERKWYQSMVDQIDADFVETVANGRDMEVSEVRELANGLAYTGTDAVENGLADEIGYYEDAIAKASELAGFDAELKTTSLTLSSSSNLAALLDVLSDASLDGASNGNGAAASPSEEEALAALQALESRFGKSE